MNELYTISLNDMCAQAEETIKKTKQNVDSLNELVAEQLNDLTEKDLKLDMNLCLCCSIICAVYSFVLSLTGYYPVAGLCCLVLSPVAGLYMYFRIKKALDGYNIIFKAQEYLNFTAQSLEIQLYGINEDLRQYSISDAEGYRFKISERESVFARLSNIETVLSQFTASGSPYISTTGKNLVIFSAAVMSIAGVLGFLPLVCDVMDELAYDLFGTTLGDWSLYIILAISVITLVLVLFLYKLIWVKSNCRVSRFFLMSIPLALLIFPLLIFVLAVTLTLGIVLICIVGIIFVIVLLLGLLFGTSGG